PRRDARGAARRGRPGPPARARGETARVRAGEAARRVVLGARGRAGADLGPPEQQPAAARRSAAGGPERPPARADLASVDRGAISAAAATGRAQPAVGAPGDDDDP